MDCSPLERRRCSPVTLLGKATEPRVGLSGRRVVVDEEDFAPGLAVRFSQPPRYRGAGPEEAVAEGVGAEGIAGFAEFNATGFAEGFNLSIVDTSLVGLV